MTLTANFDFGSNGSDILSTDRGNSDAWTIAQAGAGSGTHKYDNTRSILGPLSCKVVNGGDSNKYFSWNLPSPTNHYGRFYLYKTTTGACAIAQATPDGANRNARIDVGTFITIYDAPATGNLTGVVAVALNQWVRIEYHIIHSATVGQIEIKLFNDAHSQVPSEIITSPATWNTGTNCSSMNYGEPSTSSGGVTYWIDGIVANAVVYPGPIVPQTIRDSFSRSVSAGWGNADTGQTWTASGTVANVNVNGTKGTFQAGGSGGVAGASTPFATYEARGVFRFSMAATASNVNRIQWGTFLNGAYYFRIEDTVSGSLRLQAFQGTGPVQLGNTYNPSYTYGDEWYCRFEILGYDVKARMWKVGDAEPDWQMLGDLRLGDQTIAPENFYIYQINFDTGSVAVTIDDLQVDPIIPSAAIPKIATPMTAGKGWGRGR